jgi:hypothetical protein
VVGRDDGEEKMEKACFGLCGLGRVGILADWLRPVCVCVIVVVGCVWRRVMRTCDGMMMMSVCLCQIRRESRERKDTASLLLVDRPWLLSAVCGDVCMCGWV